MPRHSMPGRWGQTFTKLTCFPRGAHAPRGASAPGGRAAWPRLAAFWRRGDSRPRRRAHGVTSPSDAGAHGRPSPGRPAVPAFAGRSDLGSLGCRCDFLARRGLVAVGPKPRIARAEQRTGGRRRPRGGSGRGRAVGRPALPRVPERVGPCRAAPRRAGPLQSEMAPEDLSEL